MTNLRLSHFHFSLPWWQEDTWQTSHVLNHRITVFLEKLNLNTNVRVYNISRRDFIWWCLSLYMINLGARYLSWTMYSFNWRQSIDTRINITQETYQNRTHSQSLLFLAFLNFLFLLLSCITAWLANHNRPWAFWRNGLFFICYLRISRTFTNCGN